MKHLLLALFLIPCVAIAQKEGDRKLIVTLADTTTIHKNVRNALARHNFPIKEIDAVDTIQTFAAEVKGIPGYAILTAVVSGANVELSGFYGFRRSDIFGYTRVPKGYKPIMYFKGSKMWDLLLNVATKLEPAGMFSERWLNGVKRYCKIAVRPRYMQSPGRSV